MHPHLDRRCRERDVSLWEVKRAIGRATRCTPYEGREPTADGTKGRVFGTLKDGSELTVGVEAFVDHLGRRALLNHGFLRGKAMTIIRCDVCGKGHLKRVTVPRHDVSAVVGLEGVTLINAPALVCSSCGAVTLEGSVLDEAAELLTVMLVEQGDALTAGEIRYLRRVLDMTQSELADRLGMHRTTVARWEIGEVPIGKAESMAVRALVAMQLVAEHPKLAKELAAKFARPGVARTAPPYEIRVGAA